jgi:hypothetical protein
MVLFVLYMTVLILLCLLFIYYFYFFKNSKEDADSSVVCSLPRYRSWILILIILAFRVDSHNKGN